MKDMRNSLITKGDVVLVMNLMCLDYYIGMVDSCKESKDVITVNGDNYNPEDCLVLPKEYLYKVSDN